MPWGNRRTERIETTEDVVYDDAGSGLFEACTERFGPLGWTITCDSRHAVWVKDPETGYAVGLAPWTAGLHSIDETLDQVELKMSRAAKTKAPAS